MADQRIELWAAFGFVNRSHSFWIGGVRGQTVNRLGGQGDGQPFGQSCDPFAKRQAVFCDYGDDFCGLDGLVNNAKPTGLANSFRVCGVSRERFRRARRASKRSSMPLRDHWF